MPVSVHEQRLQGCDRCSAVAKFQVLVNRFRPDLDLLLCETHANEHAELLDSGKYPVLPMLGV